MIQGIIAEHLEILGAVVRRLIGIRLVESIGKAGAFDRALGDAIHDRGLADIRHLQNGRHDVDHMGELVADAALVGDDLWPGNRHALPGAAEVGRYLLGPFERRVKRPGPRNRHVVIGVFRPPEIVEVLELNIHRHLDPVEHRHLVRGAVQRAFGRGSVVARDVDDKRIVQIAVGFDRIDHAADFSVGVSEVGRIDIGLPDEHFLLISRQLVPVLEQVRRPGCQFCRFRNHPKPLLVGKDRVAQLVPSVIEQLHAFDLFDPGRCRMVRRMGAAGGIVDEPWLRRCKRVQLRQIINRLIRHGGDQVEPLFRFRGINLGGVAEQVAGRPLAGVAPHEAVEVFKSHAGGPLVEGPHHADLETRRIVVLAEPGCAVAVILQDSPHRRLVFGDDRVVARKPGGLFRNHAEADRMVVAPSDQRRTRGRAERGRMHVGIAQTHFRNAVQRRGGNDPAKGRWCAIAHVIGENQQHVRRAFGRGDARLPERCRLQRIARDRATEGHTRCRQLQAVDHAGRGRRAGGCL